MAEIKQLPRNVADQISAGEVIERPASVVKELVENSIDANSSSILIEVKNGGKEKIRVLDDGCGINNEQLELAFSRYATSKITNINDIYSLHSLGFRGEALASIASVSQVEVNSRTKNSNRGQMMIIKGSKVQSSKPCGCKPGTDITVTKLFYNTPARYKYLKTIGTEFGHISNIIYREALANPHIKFSLKHNNRILIKTPGSGKLLDCIHAIYGQEMTDNLLTKVEFTDRFVTIRGYIAQPDFNRSSRYHEIFIVNNRPVHSNILSYAVEEAYKGYKKPGRYPIVFLFIDLNPVLVDVNVHPTKKKIKFSRRNIIKDIIRKGIRKILAESNPAAKLKITKAKTKNNEVKREKLIKNDSFSETNKKLSVSNNKNNNIIKQRKNIEEIKHKKISKNKDQYIDINNKSLNVNTNDKNNKIYESKDEYENNKIKEHKIIRIMGQIHNSYIIAVIDDGFLVIDQHAAHERILYEKIKDKYNNSKVKTQPLLVPINIELTISEVELVNKYLEVLKILGFTLEPFGNKSFIIREVPLYIKNRSDKEVIREIIDKLIIDGNKMKKSDLIKRMILFMSCRGAVKAGDRLSNEEIKKLVYDLFNTSNPYRCPHGRPSLIHMTEKELKKGLGRT